MNSQNQPSQLLQPLNAWDVTYLIATEDPENPLQLKRVVVSTDIPTIFNNLSDTEILSAVFFGESTIFLSETDDPLGAWKITTTHNRDFYIVATSLKTIIDNFNHKIKSAELIGSGMYALPTNQ